MFPKIENKINYLINGIEKDGFSYCSTARQYEKMCGENGKMFEKYIPENVTEIINTNSTDKNIN
jgi:hypothetical protein